jgi:hypothetical protein
MGAQDTPVSHHLDGSGTTLHDIFLAGVQFPLLIDDGLVGRSPRILGLWRRAAVRSLDLQVCGIRVRP